MGPHLRGDRGDARTLLKKTELGRRRTTFADAPEIEVDIEQAMIEKEPVTVILSEKGWVRALKGHLDDASKLNFKDGDGPIRAVKPPPPTSFSLASSGKFFTFAADRLPGGRGHGEPLRLMVDMEDTDAFVAIFVHAPGRRLLVAATATASWWPRTKRSP